MIENQNSDANLKEELGSDETASRCSDPLVVERPTEGEETRDAKRA